MTTFNQLELLYKQFDNLTVEIDKLLEQEDYDKILEKVKQKDALIKQMAMARKTADITIEEAAIFDEKNREISKKNFEMIESLKQIHQELSKERNSNKQKIKIKNAYSIDSDNTNSLYIDTEE